MSIDENNSHRNVHWVVPRTINSLFTGRTGTTNDIKEALESSRCTTKSRGIYVVTGIGGQGKSELCLQVANMVRQE